MANAIAALRPAGAAILLVLSSATADAAIERRQFEAGGNHVVLEFLDDDLIHVAYGAGPGPGAAEAIATTDMVCTAGDEVPEGVCDLDHDGPDSFADDGAGGLETAALRLQVDPATLAVTVFDRTQNDALLTTFRAEGLAQDAKALVFTRGPELDVYGLGQQFVEPGQSDIDWDGRVREGGPFGNIMAGFNGGANGNTQIPVLYAVNGATHENYAVFLDNVYRHRWDFTSPSQWQVEVADGALQFYLMGGPDLLDLRRDFMGLVGRPPVPPRSMFGLWVSEYGYDDWAELEDKLATLRAAEFPLDGFVLDLQWFGGIPDVTGQCAMGSLTFDEAAFPDPQQTIAGLDSDEQVAIMLIEEAYVCQQLPAHAALQAEGCLARNSIGATDPAFLCGFWGCGSMIDYTDDACGAFWHDDRRQPLVDLDVVGHWTDLGEPEVFSDAAGYTAGTHRDAHNIFNFRWIRSIYDGYRRNDVERRPFMMSRSGTAGIQRFGAAMWSGDISARLTSLAAHAANQMHMSFSGIDYYGGDIGGFHRNLEGDLDEMYTQWFAYGMMFDVPGRPHTENLCNCKETAPDRIGETDSNLANARLRYALVPYLYSLAHQAYQTGEPVMPPLVMHYQTDNNVRVLGHEKLIGRDLLAAIVAQHGETARDVYLPQGTWIDWHTNRRIDSDGVWLPDVPVLRAGLFRLPLYAREGAIIPLMAVDADTRNASGERADGSIDPTLRARVFAFDTEGQTTGDFTLFEDDGTTLAYQTGAVRTTPISHARTAPDTLTVTVGGAQGTYNGASDSRAAVIELVADRAVTAVSVDGAALAERGSLAELESAGDGWFAGGGGIVVAQSSAAPVVEARSFVFTLGEATACASDFATIAMPGAGNDWNPADPARTLTCDADRRWTGRLNLLAEPYKFAADGAWAVNWGADGAQDGPDFPALEQAGLYDVVFDEDDPAAASVALVAPAAGLTTRFVCENGETTFGTSVYAVGSVPELGAWDPAQAVLLAPNGPYPTWTGLVDDLPSDGTIEWKCIKRLEGGDQRVVQWEPGANNVVDPGAADQVGQF